MGEGSEIVSYKASILVLGTVASAHGRKFQYVTSNLSTPVEIQDSYRITCKVITGFTT
jgi:hypothetical protein